MKTKRFTVALHARSGLPSTALIDLGNGIWNWMRELMSVDTIVVFEPSSGAELARLMSGEKPNGAVEVSVVSSEFDQHELKRCISSLPVHLIGEYSIDENST